VITAVPVDFPDSALEAEVLDDLARVEALLAQTAHPDEELFTEASQHAIEAGGKRFRALLVLLAARFGQPQDPRVIQAAVAIELTHLATLFHDDVMDEAEVRRGHPSVNSRWSNSVAILTGDFLFAQASRILADLGPDAVRIQAETFNRLVEGQLAETIGPRPGQDPLDHYMHVITEKTGSLIATSGRFGAMFSGAADDITTRIAVACEQIGVAWQLSDDVIDIASDPAQSGKTPGTDLRQGVRTLPVLYAMRSSAAAASAAAAGASAAAAGTSPAAAGTSAAAAGASAAAAGASAAAAGASAADARLHWLLTEADLSDDGLLTETLALLRTHPAVAESRAHVLTWTQGARSEIMALPSGPARAAFLGLCDFVEKRTG
jgi:heptaprenyl diphosphate synthase